MRTLFDIKGYRGPLGSNISLVSLFIYSFNSAGVSSLTQLNKMVLSHIVYNSLFVASLASAAASSNNWAGGQHTDKGRVFQASVDIVVPECTLGTPAYQTVPYFVSGWAGIDGTATCPHALLQAGRSSSGKQCQLYQDRSHKIRLRLYCD